MATRDHILLEMRPELHRAKVYDTMSDEEYFQNNTLRPVVALQNDLLLAAFSNYINKHKGVYHRLKHIDQKKNYIENAIQRDQKFRNSLKGMILGQFTLEEYDTYILNSSRLNKRMMHLVKERLIDQMLYLENHNLMAG
ncbi:MAG: glyoxalase [Flavobacteriaceae bacterium]|nr:glyoxalase [Flavobacteriaceae bacterium]